MNRDNHHPLPADLRRRLEEEPELDRQELERIWQLLGGLPERGEASEAPVASSAPASATDDGGASAAGGGGEGGGGGAGGGAEDVPDTEAAWSALRERLAGLPESGWEDTPGTASQLRDAHHASGRSGRAGERDRPARQTRTTRQRHMWLRAAAVVLVLVVTGAALWQLPVRVSAPYGESRTVSLPDGSTVELNSGAVITYRRGFDVLPFAVPAASRTVALAGEAFFDVRHVSGRPFEVVTFNANIHVLGTRFNVRAHGATGETEVTLVEGRVRLLGSAPPADARTVVLERPGETASVGGQASAPTNPRISNLERVLTWRNDGFAVSNLPLSAILSELERRYDARLSLEVSDVSDDSMTLYYPTRTSLETILHDISMAKNLGYRQTSRGYAIVDANATAE